MTGETGRRAVLETRHDEAELVAAALRPDNTDSMATEVDGDVVTTTIERGTTGGLHTTVDDYVVNLTVADAVCETAREHRHTTNHE